MVPTPSPQREGEGFASTFRASGLKLLEAAWTVGARLAGLCRRIVSETRKQGGAFFLNLSPP